MAKRVVLPLRKNIFEWIKILKESGYQFDDVKFQTINKIYNELKFENNKIEFKQDLGTKQLNFEYLYKRGLSISEIASLYSVSKQYVDASFREVNKLKVLNEHERLNLKNELTQYLYVQLIDLKGLEYVKELGVNGTDNSIIKKYKVLGGVNLKTDEEQRLELANKVLDEFENGMKYRELSDKYNITMKTVNCYLNLARN